MRTGAMTVIAAALVVLVAAACATGCGGTSDAEPALNVQELERLAERQEPPAGLVREWPAKWCKARPGMSDVELYALMGEPTSQFPDQASWSGYGYQFNAFFDEDGRVRQLDVNGVGLSAAQKAKLRCEFTRIDDGKGS